MMMFQEACSKQQEHIQANCACLILGAAATLRCCSALLLPSCTTASGADSIVCLMLTRARTLHVHTAYMCYPVSLHLLTAALHTSCLIMAAPGPGSSL
jgi:hypothetical protein